MILSDLFASLWTMIENIVRPVFEWIDDVIHYPTHRRNRIHKEIFKELAEKYSLEFVNEKNLNFQYGTIMFLDTSDGTIGYINNFKIANHESIPHTNFQITYTRPTILCDYLYTNTIRPVNKNKIESILMDILKKYKEIKQELKIRELNEDFE